MPDVMQIMQNWLPDWVIQSLMGLGVLIAGIYGGIRLFASGQHANEPERKSAESDLRKAISEMHADNAARHDETHERLGALGTDLAILKDRTRRD